MNYFLTEEIHINKLHELIQESLKEEELLSFQLLEVENIQDISFGQKMADKVASFGGSWLFIFSFLAFMAIWIMANIFFLNSKPFDPYPFIFLNLILSCLAALQAPIIMMSQNRQEDKDRNRSRSDYMINIKSEMEVRNLHSKVDLLISNQMKSLFDIQRAQTEILINIENSIKKMVKQ